MSFDEENWQRQGTEQPSPSPPVAPEAVWPTDTQSHAETVAQEAELSPEGLRRLRARLARKYH
jgi:hypothetical protein